MSPCIYVIKNLLDGKFYVGQALNLKRRRYLHLRDLKRGRHSNIHLQHARNKHGESAFQFYVLHGCTKDNLDDFEQYYIDNLRPAYNIVKVVGSPPTAPKTVLIDHNGTIYESVNYAARVLQVNSGDISHAVERKIHVKGFMFNRLEDGRPKMKENKTICDSFGREYKTAADAARTLGLDNSSICSVLRGEARSIGGLSFRYLERGEIPSTFLVRDKSSHRFSKPVVDNFGNKYDSVRGAMGRTKVDGKAIIEMCGGKRRTPSKGFFFQYLPIVEGNQDHC